MSYRYMQVDACGISAILPRKELVVSDDQVTCKGRPVRCHWCQWSPGSDDLKGVDGLLFGGFIKVNWLAQLAKRKHYRLAVHSCQNRRANPLQVLTIGKLKAEAKAPQRAVAEAVIVEVE
jgi:hypothetical protein